MSKQTNINDASRRGILEHTAPRPLYCGAHQALILHTCGHLRRFCYSAVEKESTDSRGRGRPGWVVTPSVHTLEMYPTALRCVCVGVCGCVCVVVCVCGG